ncbi:MAG: substrate-binding periplasmic protein [Pseudomonadota bacterium]
MPATRSAGWFPACAFALLAALLPPAGRAAPPPPQPVVLIAAEDDWYPYSAEQDGRPTGYAVDLVAAIYEAAGARLELISLPYARCMALVDAGKLAGCFDTPRDRRIETRYLWHDVPLFLARSQVFAQAGRAHVVTGPVDLEGTRVAITNGYFYGDEFHLNTRIRQEVVDSDLTALRMLAAGRVDHALVFEQVARYLFRTWPDLQGRVTAVGSFQDVPIYLSFSRTHPDAPEALRLFNRGMAEIRRNGTRERIDRHWQQTP